MRALLFAVCAGCTVNATSIVIEPAQIDTVVTLETWSYTLASGATERWASARIAAGGSDGTNDGGIIVDASSRRIRRSPCCTRRSCDNARDAHCKPAHGPN